MLLKTERVAPVRRAEIQKFDGEPMYKTSGGVIRRSKLIKLPTRELQRLGPKITDIDARKIMTDAGLVDAHLGFWMEPVNLVQQEVTHNLITTHGLEALADKIIAGTDKTLPLGMKLGEDSTPASLGDDDVIDGTPPTTAFVVFMSAYPQRTTVTASWRCFWAAGEATSATLREVVLKSADGTTDAISRIVFSNIDKGASDTLQITINWAMAEAP